MNDVKKEKEARATRSVVPTLSAIRLKEHPWKVIHAHSPDGGYLATAVSKMVTQVLRHYDQQERQIDDSRHWDTIRPTLVRAIAREEARDFDDEYWLMLIHEGSNKMRIECCEDSHGSLCYLRAIQGHSGGIPISPELMKYTLLPCNWKDYHRGIS